MKTDAGKYLTLFSTSCTMLKNEKRLNRSNVSRPNSECKTQQPCTLRVQPKIETLKNCSVSTIENCLATSNEKLSTRSRKRFARFSFKALL